MLVGRIAAEITSAEERGRQAGLEEAAELRRVLTAIAEDCEKLAATWTPDHPEITKAEARTWAAVGRRARAALSSGGTGDDR